MRVRTLAAVMLAAVALTLVSASPASASETIGSCIVETAEEFGGFEAVEGDPALLEELGEEAESCVEAPNPILPEINEIIWGGLAFFVLLVLMVWKGVPMVRAAMDARAEKVRSDLDAAERAKVAAGEVQAEYEAKLADAKSEASRIIDEARSDADQFRAELQRRAEQEVAEMKAHAVDEISTSRAQALADLRNDVAAIAIGAAERVIGANLDPAIQNQLIDEFISDVASN